MDNKKSTKQEVEKKDEDLSVEVRRVKQIRTGVRGGKASWN